MTMYARTGGRAIHTLDCRMLNGLAVPPTLLSRQEAQALGFGWQPCRVCSPDIHTRPKRPKPERQCYHGEWSE